MPTERHLFRKTVKIWPKIGHKKFFYAWKHLTNGDAQSYLNHYRIPIKIFIVNRQIWVNDSKYGIFDDKFLPPFPIMPQIPKFCITNVSFLLETHCSHYHRCTCATDFFHSTWVQGVAYQKQLLGPKSMWVCARGAFQKCGTLFIYATIKARNSKFGIQLEFAE